MFTLAAARRNPGVRQLLVILERTIDDASRLLANPFDQVTYGLICRAEYVDALFRQIVRFFDALCSALNTALVAASRELAPLEAGLERPLGGDKLTLLQLGLWRDREGRWEMNYLELEHHLAKQGDLMPAILEEFAAICLRPLVDAPAEDPAEPTRRPHLAFARA